MPKQALQHAQQRPGRTGYEPFARRPARRLQTGLDGAVVDRDGGVLDALLLHGAVVDGHGGVLDTLLHGAVVDGHGAVLDTLLHGAVVDGDGGVLDPLGEGEVESGSDHFDWVVWVWIKLEALVVFGSE